MSRSGRRRTLCHSEIENFLSEIPNIVRSSSQLTSSNSNNMQPTEEDMLRRYCKMMFAEKNDDRAIEEYFQIARTVFKGSNYRLLSTRLIHPELFEFPSSTLEAKKALLLSLSPMLKEAEEQKKKDSSACESFTRCKSIKGKGSYGVYEYIDIDTQQRVEFSDFERRYMLFIESTKSSNNKAVTVERKQPPQQQPLLHAVLAECSAQQEFSLQGSCKENVATHHNYSFSEGLSLSPSQIIRKEKSSARSFRAVGGGSKQSERRITLSPATAKALLLTALEEDKDAAKSSSIEREFCGGAPELKTSMNNESTTHVQQPVSAAVSTISTGGLPSNQADMTKNLGKELDGILANFDDCPLTTSTNLLQPCSSELLMVEDFLFDDTASFHIAPCSPAKCDPASQTEFPHASSHGDNSVFADQHNDDSAEHGNAGRRASFAFPIASSRKGGSKRRNSVLGAISLVSVAEPSADPNLTQSYTADIPASSNMITADLEGPLCGGSGSDLDSIKESSSEVWSAQSSHNLEVLRELVTLESSTSNDSEHQQTIILGDHINVNLDSADNSATKSNTEIFFENSSRAVPVLVDNGITNIDLDMTDTEEVRVEFPECIEYPLLNTQSEKMDGQCERSSLAEVINTKTHPISENARDDFFPKNIIDEAVAKDHAFARMCERFEVARWKFRWEQVSVTAANYAWLRYTRPKHS